MINILILILIIVFIFILMFNSFASPFQEGLESATDSNCAASILNQNVNELKTQVNKMNDDQDEMKMQITDLSGNMVSMQDQLKQLSDHFVASTTNMLNPDTATKDVTSLETDISS